MLNYIDIIILLSIFLCSLIAIFIIIKFINKFIFNRKMIKQTINLFKEKENIKNKRNHNVIHVKNAPHNLYCDTIKYHLYIKLIKNEKNDALFIKSKYEWFLKDNKTEKSIDIKSFIDEEYTHIDSKEVVKLVILYPNSSAVLKYINECEIDMIYPTNKVFGLYILNYEKLNKDKKLKRK